MHSAAPQPGLRSWRLLAAVMVSAAACSAPAESYRYEGVAVNHADAAAPSPDGISGTLTITATSGADWPWTGNVLVGAPLLGSGEAELVPWGDSLLVISISPTADTIVWLASREGTAYVGTYLVVGGPYLGQGGRWAVRQVSSRAFRTTEPPRQALRDWLNGELAQLQRTPATSELDSGRDNIETEAPPRRPSD